LNETVRALYFSHRLLEELQHQSTYISHVASRRITEHFAETVRAFSLSHHLLEELQWHNFGCCFSADNRNFAETVREVEWSYV
jgi:hypothetical protein